MSVQGGCWGQGHGHCHGYM